MKTSSLKRLASLLMILALVVSLFSAIPVQASDAGTAETPLPLADLGGTVENDSTDAYIGWTNDALPQEQMKALINSQTLHPQRTGYVEMDNRLAELLEPYKDADTYTKIQAIYKWAIENVVYTHNGYGYIEGATNQYDYLTKTFYVDEMTYEEGLQKAIPDKVINHASYALFECKGACYDYASLLAVAIRYIGINAYVHTGYWILESDGSYNNHHGWTEIELDGKLYILDPQREARYTERMGSVQNIYFGIPHENGADWRYWSPDTEANAERDALFLSVTADREDPKNPTDPDAEYNPGTTPGTGEETYTLKVVITGNGSITCDATEIGEYTYQVKSGDKIHMEATPGENSAFRSWWDKNKREYLHHNEPAFESAAQISADEGVTFFIDENLMAVNGVIVIEAVFSDTVNLSIVSSRSGSVQSYGADVLPQQEHLIGDQVPLTAVPNADKAFVGWYDKDGKLLSEEDAYNLTVPNTDTTIYALFEGDVFCDMTDDLWYLDDVMEAVDLGLVDGVTPVTFEGDAFFTRGMAVVMLARLDGADIANAPVSDFVDVEDGAWFADAINWAADAGLVLGKDETHFMPDDPIKREEFVAIMVRYLEYKGITLEPQELTYTDMDEIDEYALEYLQKAQSIGLIQGDPGGTFRPRDTLLRSEGTTVMVRLTHYLNEAKG